MRYVPAGKFWKVIYLIMKFWVIGVITPAVLDDAKNDVSAPFSSVCPTNKEF